jgi:hypothetical protein
MRRGQLPFDTTCLLPPSPLLLLQLMATALRPLLPLQPLYHYHYHYYRRHDEDDVWRALYVVVARGIGSSTVV